jgi:hypothetical protein
MGCVEGQLGALLKPSELTVLYIWEAWSGESKFLPSQHAGKWCVVKIPPEQGFVGMVFVMVPLLPPLMHW